MLRTTRSWRARVLCSGLSSAQYARQGILASAWVSSAARPSHFYAPRRRGLATDAIYVLSREDDNILTLIDRITYYSVPPTANSPPMEPPAYSATPVEAGNPEYKKEYLKEMISEITIHRSVEEMYLHPLLRIVSPHGVEIANECAQLNKRIIRRLVPLNQFAHTLNDNERWHDFPIGDLQELRELCQEHMRLMESRIYPELRRKLTEEKLVELAHTLSTGRLHAPTEPEVLLKPPGEEVLEGMKAMFGLHSDPSISANLAQNIPKGPSPV